MARLGLTLLGGFQARLAGGPLLTLPTRKAQALVAYLALRPGQAHPRDKLAAFLWGDTGEEQARASLRQTVFVLRKTLAAIAPSSLLIEGETLALSPAAVDIDVTAFEQAVAQATPEALEQAAALYQGDFLEGLSLKEPPFEDWLLTERERLRELALETLAKLLAHQSRAEHTEAAIQTAVRLLALDPLQEVVHRALMRLYARQGRRGTALKQYQVCVGVLERELHAEPEPETRQLYQEILQRRSAQAVKLETSDARQPHQPRRAPDRFHPEIPTFETPLIGREAQLLRLQQALERAARGNGHVVAIVGEAGIGKTRLVEELTGHALRDGGRVLLGRCHASEQVVPFAPWVDAFRGAHVTSDRELLHALGPVWRTELARLLPELEDLGAEPPAAESPGRLFEAVAQLVERLAADHSLVLVLEDLHWADEMSLRLFAFLGRRLPSWPVLAVITAREEEVAGAAFLAQLFQELDRAGCLVQLPLPPLSQPEAAALVRALARAGSDEAAVAHIADQVWAASEGNPFVVVETMRALGDGKASQSPAGLLLSRGVRDLIAGHLDRLSRRSRDLAAAAAVIGREFEFALLQRVARHGEQEAAEGVEELVRRRIFHGVGERFDFTHDRIRQVADERLLPPTRQALHAAVGEALEDLHGDDLANVYDRLAYHYSKTDRSDKAAEYLIRFAELAARGGGHAEAIAALDQAMLHVPRLPDTVRERRRLDVVFQKARSLFFLGRFDDTLALLLAEEPTIQAAGNPRLAGAYYFRLGNTLNYLGEHTRAVESAERALEEATRSHDVATVGKAHFLLALERFWAQPVRGVEHGRKAVELLRGTKERWWLGQAYWTLGLNLSYLGRFDEGLEMEARAQALAEGLADRRLESYAAWASGFIHTLAGDWDLGVAACTRSCELSLDPLNTMTALGMLALAHVERGNPDAAIPPLERAIGQARRFRFPQFEGLLVTFRGEAALQKGDLTMALGLAQQGLQITRAAGYEYAVGWTQRVLARIARAAGDREGAHRHFEDTIATFSSMGAPFEAARTRLELAELLDTGGDRAAALDHGRQALDALGALGLTRFVDRARTLVEALTDRR